MLVSPRLCIASRLLCLKVLVKSPTSSMFAHNGISGLHIEYNGDDLTAHILLGDFYSFNVSQNSSTHFTRSNYGYLNSIIIIIMVTATINENDKTGITCKHTEK